MPESSVDVVVIGTGPGGEHAAIKLGRAGLDVVAVEDRLVGGECPYYGCVPSKMMVNAAHLLASGHRVSELAGTAELSPDWSKVANRIREEATSDWDDAAAVERLEESGVRLVRGRGRLAGPGRVEVDGTTYAAARGVVLNAGTSPAVPPIDGLEGTPYWTNRDVVRLTELPGSLIVLGGGPIGLELAQALARFDVEVTVVEAGDRILPQEEPEACGLVAEALRRDGARVLAGAPATKVSHVSDRFHVQAGEEELVADRLLVATGRSNNLVDVGLDTVGLDSSAKSVEVDGRMRAGDRLWAVGDITGKGGYTHTSMYQAAIAVRDILGEDGPEADYRAVPRVTFTEPEVGSVGMTEQQARDAGLAVRTGLSPDLGARGWLAASEGLVKVVEADGVLVGGTCVGISGGEVMSFLALAVQARVPVSTLLGMQFAYPAYYRAVETALKELG